MKKLLTTLFCLPLFFAAQAQENDLSFTVWNGAYEKTNFEIVFGYVNKSWVSSYSVGTQREDFFGDYGKYLHGMQIGALYTPSFDWGLGLRTGVAFEFYFSRSEVIRDFGWSGFNEADLYVPVQASFRIPFNERSGVTVFAGPAFQLAMAGNFSKVAGAIYRGWYRRPIIIGKTKKMEYGYGWPEQVNWQADMGLDFRFGIVGLSLSYSLGFSNHRLDNTFDEGFSYETASRSRQDKMNFALTFLF